MLVRKRMKKMMERAMKMKRKMRLRVEQGSGQLKMMMKMMLSLRSRRRTIKRGRPAEHLPNPPLLNSSSGGRQKCGHHQVEFSICVHTPNCKFCRNNQDFKALPSYKIL
ncbi:hypothetical protein PGIGA_G00110960 [Pangasianodon gigas]|uniref:Uncharacterized protein n=1 Tax=Pangasianodon gigas TaxID=30993 RepID=A0ACC5W995_PANGG|nr:hypothetical protein [Pangasianodon gigas]